jgi:hypothetical protein
MKIHEVHGLAGTPVNGISLRKVVSRFVSSLSHSAAVNKVILLNQVSSEFRLPDEQVKVISVIKELLATMASNARDTCISVTAEKYRDIIILKFEDQNNYNGYALSFSLIAIEQHARFAGRRYHHRRGPEKSSNGFLQFSRCILHEQPGVL